MVNRFVRGIGEDQIAAEALRGFERFPIWMWRNTVVRDFADWLRDRNGWVEARRHLETVDPEPPWLGWRCALCCSGRHAAALARQRYSCFDHASADDDGQAYGFAAAFGAGQSCEQEAVEQLIDFQRNSVDYARRDGLLAEDELSNSVEELFHETDADAFYVKVRDDGRPSAQPLDDIWLGRAIGVISTHPRRNGRATTSTCGRPTSSTR
jgi:hypothetical protein